MPLLKVNAIEYELTEAPFQRRGHLSAFSQQYVAVAFYSLEKLNLGLFPWVVVIFAGLLAFMVRFVREPRADYGIGTAGIIMVRSDYIYRP